MSIWRLVTVLLIGNVGANGDADGILVSVLVRWWETSGYIDEYEEVSGNIDEYKDVLILSDGVIDGDMSRFQSTLSQIPLSVITRISNCLK